MIGGRQFGVISLASLLVVTALCAGCSVGHSNAAYPVPTSTARSSTSAPQTRSQSPSETAARSSATGALGIVISGGGRGTVTLTDVRCDPSQLTATAGPGGLVQLDRTHAVLRVTGVAPLGTATFNGAPPAAPPASGAPISFRGTAVGMSATLTARC